MDERQESQKDKIKKQVDINKSHTLDGTNLGSQNGAVNHFGVQRNDKNSEEDKQNIRNKINATKARNLQQSGSASYVPNYDDSLSSVPSNSDGDDYLGDEDDKNPVVSAAEGAYNFVSGANNLRKGAKKLLGNKGKKGAETGLNAAGKGLEASGKTAAKGAQTAAKGAKTAAQTGAKALQGTAKLAGTVGKAAVAAVSKIIAFLASVIGVPLLITIGILALVIFIIILIHIIISSYGQKFGVDSTNIEEFLREANVEKIEGLSREEVEEMLKGLECKLSPWAAFRNFFGVPDLEDPCTNQHLIKKELENREKNGDNQDRHGRKVTVKTKDELAPGYFFATSYYAYDSQNLNEEGEHYIPLVTSKHTQKNSDGEELYNEVITDLDVITTLLNTKKLDTCTGTDKDGNPTGCKPIYTLEEIKELLDNYIFFEDHHNDDSSHGEGPYIDEYGYKWGFPYWLYQYIIVGYDENDDPIYDWACVQQVPETYYTDELKFKLYLRYGENVMAEYERDKNWNLQWQKTSGECKNWSGWTKWANGDLEENGSVSLTPPPKMDKYNKKADPDSKTDDNAKVTLESGITYGYDSGFIFNTYPRYDDNYITVPREYGYKIDKEIERLIQTIDSRQDYTNYFLGYESSVAQFIAGINNGSYDFNGGAVCKYDFDGVELDNIMVRLLDNDFNPIQGQELISFEDYIMGVVNAETGGYPSEAQKVEAIAARTYALYRTKVMNKVTLKQENGQWILSIRSSTADQTYCDPTKNCYYDCPGYRGATYAEGTQPSTCTSENLWKKPLSSDQLGALKNNVKEVSGMLLVDANGKLVNTPYNSSDHHNWRDMANGTWNGGSGEESDKMDYVEILREQYGSDNQITSPDCSYGVTGEWSEWKQYSEPWGNIQIGSSSNINLHHYGCYMTCHAMIIASGAKNILIPNFNPGTFAEYLKANGGFTASGDLYPNKALDLAVGAGNWESRPIDLNGSYSYKVSQIASLLEDGYGVILRVKSPASDDINNAGSQHYVVVTGISGNTIYMADPASNETIVLNKYINEGLTWAKGIKFK